MTKPSDNTEVETLTAEAEAPSHDQMLDDIAQAAAAAAEHADVPDGVKAQVASSLKALGFKLTPKQKTVRKTLGGPETHCLVYGGSRSGKTFLLVYCVVIRALRAPGSRHLICRKATKHVKTSIFMDTFPKVMRLAFPGVPYKDNKSDLYVILPNDAEIWFGGLDDKERVEKILGQEYATVYVNECSQLSYDAVVMLRSRLAQNCVCADGKPLKLKAYYDLNPTGKSHWTYKEFVENVDPKSGKPLKTGRRIFGTINPRENPHLPSQYVDEILEDMPERQRQRFLDGKYINEVPGALWKLDDLEENRLDAEAYDEKLGTVLYEGRTISLKRIVVAVDPMVAKKNDGETWDLGECGIVVVGLGDDDRAYVIADGSERLSPDGWAAKAIALYHGHRADRIIAEANNGGEMVRLTIATADATKEVGIELVHASRGKIPRAEPVSVLYAKGRISHVGNFPELEDQMTSYTGAQGENSPDRMDALVWGVTALKLAPEVPAPFID